MADDDDDDSPRAEPLPSSPPAAPLAPASSLPSSSSHATGPRAVPRTTIETGAGVAAEPERTGAFQRLVNELSSERNRDKLLRGTAGGYVTVVAFALFALAAHAFGLIAWSRAIPALVGVKLVTNTVALLALYKRRYVAPTSAVNVAADVVVLTGAVYVTGGPLSPLVPVYLGELTVIALLTNGAVTIGVAVMVLLCHGGMVVLLAAHAIPPHPPPISTLAELGPAYVTVYLVVFAFVLSAPTLYISLIVSNLQRNERALADRSRELAEAGRQKSQFMANITHELRTPLYGIVGLADVLEDGAYGPLTDKQRQALGNIQKSAAHLEELIDTLLTLARADAGRLEFRAGPVDLRDVLESVAASARWMIGRRPLELAVEAPGELPALHTDRAKLVQVLINLLSNAIKFTPDGGRVALRAEFQGEGESAVVALAVADNGPGIAPGDHAKVFEAFYQVDGSAERGYGGAGLGLALVRELVALLGGAITLESEAGRGATFTVLLPVR